jgi:hypothetical protein
MCCDATKPRPWIHKRSKILITLWRTHSLSAAGWINSDSESSNYTVAFRRCKRPDLADVFGAGISMCFVAATAVGRR